jgi:hypothetical protein
MKRTVRYLMLALGWTAGIIFGMWLLRRILVEFKERGTAKDTREHIPSSGLHGDDTTDAPPPEEREQTIGSTENRTAFY